MGGAPGNTRYSGRRSPRFSRSRSSWTVMTGRPLSSGCISSHFAISSSELKRLFTPQPPPKKILVVEGRNSVTRPFSKTRWIRSPLYCEASSTVTFLSRHFALTNAIKSSAQNVSSGSCPSTCTRWYMKSIFIVPSQLM